MAIIRKNPPKPVIDLRGPQGNAFAMIGIARDLGKKLGWTKEKIEGLTRDMMSSDYDHLIEIFDDHFGEMVDLLVPEAG